MNTRKRQGRLNKITHEHKQQKAKRNADRGRDAKIARKRAKMVSDDSDKN